LAGLIESPAFLAFCARVPDMRTFTGSLPTQRVLRARVLSFVANPINGGPLSLSLSLSLLSFSSFVSVSSAPSSEPIMNERRYHRGIYECRRLSDHRSSSCLKFAGRLTQVAVVARKSSAKGATCRSLLRAVVKAARGISTSACGDPPQDPQRPSFRSAPPFAFLSIYYSAS